MTPLVQEALRRGSGLTIVDAYADSRFDREADDVSTFHTLRLMIQPIYDSKGWVLGALTLTRGWPALLPPEVVWKEPSLDVYSLHEIEVGQGGRGEGGGPEVFCLLLGGGRGGGWIECGALSRGLFLCVRGGYPGIRLRSMENHQCVCLCGCAHAGL